MQSRTFGEFSRETRKRRLLNIRARVHGGTYETACKLDAAVNRMIDVEGFTSHPPVMRASDAAMYEMMNDEFQRQTETDR